MKMLLKQAAVGRDLASFIIETLAAKSDQAELTAMSEQTSNYDRIVKEAGAGHYKGPPHIWAFAGLVVSMSKSDMVKMCRADKMFKEGLSRVSLSIPNDSIRMLGVNSMVQLGAERKQGRAPRSNQEWELQAWLEALLDES